MFHIGVKYFFYNILSENWTFESIQSGPIFESTQKSKPNSAVF